ncbi:MAG: hypothetical protein UW69_C0002G0011 [Microgenomates group bacterium GW2011_GWA2_44_7]|uniref:Uncharacterized protein n=1 Tax=Candidatus Woesebacteria bacterium GW2011_GWA1_43_12 TaxID=1618557 RepID=A0A0G1FUA2_9BACT|nr:MAG: hypothetical protein UV66_C0004G0010 [Candidatus Woesebacteria bacterium GW2011_GWA1_43_12]KKT76253.1 MAG: hypothetical protein UW69_C0002G0011 [Microgenomates group bacterium GW2011_GWA2_44_7]KKT77727.1 MAG: hypothetical protein UW73_C0013G0010 [Microgenomates group bacterium GW2011_GWB1_44_8]
MGVTFLFAYYSKDLPSPDAVVRREGFSTKIFDRNGKLLYDVFKQARRTPVKLEDVPLSLRQATIAIEDKNFYKHQGFDPAGYLRIVYNLVFRRRLTGGSTLTQQLVKNALLTPQRTVVRKIKEFILSVEIEKKFSKVQILQMYLNEAPYGGTAVGIVEAADTYFGKKVSELNLVESAVLAGLPQEPSRLTPFGLYPTAYQARTKDVLRRMREDGYITADQEKMAAGQVAQVNFASHSGELKAPHFVFYVKDILNKRYGESVVESRGLSVVTTLDLDLQEKAQAAVSEEIAKVINLKITNGAALVMNPKTGEILSMVGSRRWDDPNYDGKVNVVLSLRQPGSTIKPVTYVTGFKNGYTPSSMLMDVATTFPGGVNLPDYKPVNYDGKFHGPLSIRTALGSSINVPAVKMLALVGIKDMLSTAYDMGILSLEPTDENLQRLGLSVTLGGGEVRLLDLVSAYSSFANGGFRKDPVAILKVTDRDGRILEEFYPSEGNRVLSPGQAFLINNILSDNDARSITFSPNSLLNIPGKTVAVKTGTTNDKRDNWTIGWTPSRIVGVWVGNNNNSEMTQVASGVTGAAPIWRRILLGSLDGIKDEKFPVPPEVTTAEVDKVSGFRAHDGFPSRLEYFIQGTEPPTEDPIHKMLKVCRSSGKLATPADIAHGVFDAKEFYIFKEKDPTAVNNGTNRWQEGIDSWLSTQSDSKYHPPTEYCDTANDVVVNIESPSDQQQINSNSFDIKANSQSIGNINRMEIFIDDQSKATSDHETIAANVNVPDGPHKITVKASDDRGRSAEVSIKVGINVAWDWSAATPTPVLLPTATP